jgi:endonuclease IV
MRTWMLLTHDHDVRIALETMAGKGTEIGRSFEELARIIESIPMILSNSFKTPSKSFLIL